MDHLRNALRVIDQNSDKLPEGDYLEICNHLRNAYRDRDAKEMATLIDYEHFDIFVSNQPGDVLDHFYDHYYSTAILSEENFLRMQLTYLYDELNYNKPLQRATKSVKGEAIRQYCMLHNILLEQYDEETLRTHLDESGCDLGDSGTKFEKGVKQMYKSYIALENTYREIYSTAIQRRISKINGWIENLDDM